MIYTISYKESRRCLFDIEMYLKENDLKKDEWYVELHASSFISGVVNFLMENGNNINLKEFEDDCFELEELRGWLWETHFNHPRSMDEASKDKREWQKYVEDKIYAFAKKYGLAVNTD